jgi:hypothetical protein
MTTQPQRCLNTVYKSSNQKSIERKDLNWKKNAPKPIPKPQLLILSCLRRLYEMGIGLTTGFIGLHTITVAVAPTLQPLLQPTLMASLAITH